MASGDLKGIINDFIAETEDIFDKVDKDLVELEGRPDDLELVNEIFRSIHTVKGSASFLGFGGMVAAVHEVENLLNLVRRKDLKLTPETNTQILKSIDTARDALENIKKDSDSARGPANIREFEEAFEKDRPPAPKPPAPAGEDERTVRVRVSRLNKLVNLVGELVQGRNQLSQLATIEEKRREGDADAMRLSEAAANISHITSELQQAIMNTRMQSISKVFSLLPRIVRDLAAEQGKEARLEISGETTEVDRSVIEGLQESLIHFVRNAIDHGIEKPEERLAKSKPREGKIKITAAYEGDSVALSVVDDGRGVDVDAVRQVAVDNDLISFEHAARLSNDNVISFIFSPGFTTRAEADLTSGRGVGLDAVMNVIKKINGSISVDSAPGKGCEIRIKVPLKLAISQALIVNVGSETLAIPATAVEETTRLSPSMIRNIEGREMITLRNVALPLLRLSDILEIQSVPGKWLYAAVARVAEKRFALLVDAFRGREEIVIKPINDLLKVEGVSGASILGDGRVAFVLDMGKIAESAATAKKGRGSLSGGGGVYGDGAPPRALIADGSEYYLREEKESFEKAGYEVLEARDEFEAMKILKESRLPFDIILLDAALPEIGGIRLTERLKADAAHKTSPVVLLTSLFEHVDRDYGYHIGVEDFIIRQEVENLPAAVSRFISR